MEYNFMELQDELKKQLPKRRYYHTLGVEYTSACLAMRYGVNVAKARVGGLLHDCAKYLPDEEMLLQCKKSRLAISAIEERNPYLLHAKLGAFFAEKKYSVREKDVLDSITYHTTGRPGMSQLEMIIFTADYMEPSRKEIPGLAEIRRLAFINLEETVYLILENTLSYLCSHKGKKEIDPLTEVAYEYYKKIKKEENTGNEYIQGNGQNSLSGVR